MRRNCYVIGATVGMANMRGVLAMLPPLAPYLEKMPPCVVTSAQSADKFLNCVMDIEESYQGCDNDPERCICDSLYTIQSRCLDGCSYDAAQSEQLVAQVADVCQQAAVDIGVLNNDKNQPSSTVVYPRQLDFADDPPARAPVPTIATRSLMTRVVSHEDIIKTATKLSVSPATTGANATGIRSVSLPSETTDDDYDDCIPETATRMPEPTSSSEPYDSCTEEEEVQTSAVPIGSTKKMLEVSATTTTATPYTPSLTGNPSAPTLPNTRSTGTAAAGNSPIPAVPSPTLASDMPLHTEPGDGGKKTVSANPSPQYPLNNGTKVNSSSVAVPHLVATVLEPTVTSTVASIQTDAPFPFPPAPGNEEKWVNPGSGDTVNFIDDSIEEKLRESERAPMKYPLDDNTDYMDRVQIPEQENGGPEYHEYDNDDDDDDDDDDDEEEDDNSLDIPFDGSFPSDGFDGDGEYRSPLDRDWDSSANGEEDDEAADIEEYGEEDEESTDVEEYGEEEDDDDGRDSEEEGLERAQMYDERDEDDKYDPDCNEEEKERKRLEEQEGDEGYEEEYDDQEEEGADYYDQEEEDDEESEYDPDCNDEEKARKRLEEERGDQDDYNEGEDYDEEYDYEEEYEENSEEDDEEEDDCGDKYDYMDEYPTTTEQQWTAPSKSIHLHTTSTVPKNVLIPQPSPTSAAKSTAMTFSTDTHPTPDHTETFIFPSAQSSSTEYTPYTSELSQFHTTTNPSIQTFDRTHSSEDTTSPSELLSSTQPQQPTSSSSERFLKTTKNMFIIVSESPTPTQPQSTTITPSPRSTSMTLPRQPLPEHQKPRHSNMKGAKTAPVVEVKPTTVTRTVTKNNSATSPSAKNYLIATTTMIMAVMLLL
ncbi:hypothetical protein TRICI_002028 [Trichomonascus ciferrii]|uniref:Uncharacterized protein n=1 Tax=Trichomonascus ciferrii TaxID=44093 RepID=A0A642V7L6_9ASCO|nr:hypothetical protein TRICI_002028 [Trichomonascus ciferrii]